MLQGSSYMQCKIALEEFNKTQATLYGSKEEGTLSVFGHEIFELVHFTSTTFLMPMISKVRMTSP